MVELFGDQLVPHAIEDPEGAAAAMEKEQVLTSHLEFQENKKP